VKIFGFVIFAFFVVKLRNGTVRLTENLYPIEHKEL